MNYLRLLLLGSLLHASHIAASEVIFTYDAAGRLTAARFDAATNLVFAYDSSGSLLHEATYVSPAAPDLAVTQTVLPATPLAGFPFEFRATAVNLSAAPASAIRLVADIPSGWTVLSALANRGTATHSANAITCELDSLEPGADLTLTVTFRASTAGSFTENLTLTAASDALPSNNQSTINVTVLPPPALALSGISALTWPAFTDRLVLEETSSLSAPVLWTPNSSFGLTGNLYRSTIAPETGNRFYRLRLLE